MLFSTYPICFWYICDHGLSKQIVADAYIIISLLGKRNDPDPLSQLLISDFESIRVPGGRNNINDHLSLQS